MRGLKKRLTAISTAIQAGWVASECQKKNPIFHCIINDEEQEIIPCFRHSGRIGDLAKRNAEAQ